MGGGWRVIAMGVVMAVVMVMSVIMSVRVPVIMVRFNFIMMVMPMVVRVAMTMRMTALDRRRAVATHPRRRRQGHYAGTSCSRGNKGDVPP